MAMVKDLKASEASATTILSEELTALRDRIAANIVAQGSNATGRTIQSLTLEVMPEDSAIVGRLYARDYFGALETGTRAWTKQYAKPPKFFVDLIQQWITAKGLDLSAFLVARKIMREGSSLYRKGGRDTIYSQEIPKTIDAVQERIAQFWQETALSHITLNTK